MHLQSFKLERFFAEYEFKAPHLLCCSDCEAMTLGDLLNLETHAASDFKDLWLGYTESLGHPLLRQEIAGLYEGINANHVLVHTGAEEAIFNAMNVILQPGDHVVVQYPCYQSLTEVATSIGCEVTHLKLEDGPDWKLNLNFLENALKPTTRLLIINSPHNPTGYQLTNAEFQQIVTIAQKHGIVVFSDEVYRLLEYNEQDRLPSLCEVDETGISLGVMSKSFGLAGLRIGWIVTRNQDLFQKMAAYKDYTTICNSAPSEYLSIVALRNRERLLARNLRIIKDNLELLNTFFKKYQTLFSWKTPKAGPIAFPGYLQGDVAAFCHDLVTKSGVLLLPGTLYDGEYNNFRIGYGRANMNNALAILDEYLEIKG